MANRKISDLTALTAPATGDLLPIVDISEAAAANKNKKITFGVFLASALSSAPLGTAAAPSIAFSGDPNTGIYSPGADQLAISTSGTAKVLFDNTTAPLKEIFSSVYYPIATQVDIGTSPNQVPINAYLGTMAFQDSAGVNIGLASIGLGTAAAPSIAFTGDINTGIYSPGADQVAIATGGQARLTVNASGNVEVPGSIRAGNSAEGASAGNLATQLAATPPSGALMAEVFCVGSSYNGTANTHTGFYSACWSSFTNTITVIKDVNHSAGSNQGFEAVWSGTQVVVRNKTGMSNNQAGRAFIRWLA